MKKYTEKAREIPVSYEADVVVCGSGPAGMAAAVTAGRLGARVLLIEQQGAVGGISTVGYMSHWTGDCNSKIYHEILKRSAELNEGEWKDRVDIYIDPEKLKYLYNIMLSEAKVSVLLYTFISDTIVEDGEVRGVVIENKTGRSAVYGKVIIDATGDGDVAAKSGAEYFTGRESDGKMQPVTAMFKVGGVDTSRAAYLSTFETTYDTEKGELQDLARKHLPAPAGHVLTYRSTLPGIVTLNMTNVTGIDGTKAEELSKAEVITRKQMFEIVDFLREYVPGFEKCYVIGSASLIGVRETRHFKGVKTITEQDILEARVFDDWVVRDAYFNFDVHNLTGSGLDATGVQHKFSQKKGYTIPYGCLVPEKINGLLLAGRDISGTHMAHSNYRVMPICAGMGEAAGVAAYLAVRNGKQPRDITAGEIQKYLI